MNKKHELRKNIHEIDFALLELNLFLDTHPQNAKAMELMSAYRKKRQQAITLYEERYGKYINTVSDVPCGGCWKWLDGPWPWENNCMED